MDSLFFSWAASKEVAQGWYLFLGLLIVVSVWAVFDWRFLRVPRKSLSVVIAIGALFGLVMLSTTDVGMTWPNLVSAKDAHSPEILQGEKVFFKYGCLNCHQVGDYGVPAGPNLAGISTRRDFSSGTTFIREYGQGDLHSIMPDYRQIMSLEEQKLLIDFLMHL